MKKPFPALCKDCKFSAPEHNGSSFHKCHNPEVNARDEYALSMSIEGEPYGSSCSQERRKRVWAACGIRGKLWEPK